MKIVDEFTGRILEGRRWSEGLHQAVEAKEGVKIKEENQTLATITLQNYFRMYEKLAGMTGTAATEAAELDEHLRAAGGARSRPTRPMVRGDHADLIYKSEAAKFDAVVEDIAERHETGQPVLVGTVSVEKSEMLSRMLRQARHPHEVLNAKQHTREALHRRPGRPARSGHGGHQHGRPRRRHHPRRQPRGPGPPRRSARPSGARSLESAEERAGPATSELLPQVRRTRCKAEGDKVRELGGLYVLGTERHESRRIDNQLRGRSGRQGDPGESRFYLSLDDELMRLFATGAMSWVMGKALPDDVPIEAKMVTKAIERAQTTVEQRNAEIRKNVLKYDEVMNEQRKVIYRRRDQILEGADLRAEALEYLADAVDTTIEAHCVAEFAEEWDLEGLVSRRLAVLPDRADRGAAARRVRATDEIYDARRWPRRPRTTSGARPTSAPSVMREVERQVMLRIIDQRWREHLYEMDYLQEGINLRAMGQKDPLVEWQREGFEMFGQMMHGIAAGLRALRHARAGRGTRSQPDRRRCRTSSTRRPTTRHGRGGMLAGGRWRPTTREARAGATRPADAAAIVKSEWEKTPRNAPCPCGSGKKYKMCHG